MSGSCTTRTCWMRLPNFRLVGENLKEKFEGASRILVTNAENENSHGLSRRKRNRYKSHLLPHNPEHKPPGSMDLVYTEPSPDFCEKNSRLGILGTTGRVCNETSMGVDGCDLMCCSRGYKTQEMIVVERCGCTFQWCCEVKCNVCRIKKNVHTCLWGPAPTPSTIQWENQDFSSIYLPIAINHAASGWEQRVVEQKKKKKKWSPLQISF